MRNIILILTVAFFSGCSSHVDIITLNNKEVLESDYISFSPASNNWYLYDDRKWSVQSNGKSQWLNLNNNSIKGTTYDIEVQAYPFKWMSIDVLFDKNGDYEARHKQAVIADEIDKEQNINYQKAWTTYVDSLKCLGSVFSRNHGGTLYSARTKNYSITCGYYDKTETENDGKRILRVAYKYNYANDKSRLQKDTNLKREELLTAKQAEDGLKQAVKELVKTIKIKNFDRERMEKEGLMHYDKEFKSTKW